MGMSRERPAAMATPEHDQVSTWIVHFFHKMEPQLQFHLDGNYR